MAPSRAPSAPGPRRLLPGYRPPIALLASPQDWECTGGEILPRIMVLEARPGVNGNGPHDRHDPTGAVSVLEREGYQRLPAGLSYKVWGQVRDASSPATQLSGSTLVDYYESAGGGIYSEAWVSLRLLGGQVISRTDLEGKRNLQRAVRDQLFRGATPDDDMTAAALREPLRAARSYQGRAETVPLIRARLVQVLEQIPRDLIPPDLLPYVKPAAQAQEA